MPIMPLTSNPPLPIHDRELTAENREKGECPIRTFDWYRLPQLFDACSAIFGKSFYNQKSRTRLMIDEELRFVCDCFRDKYTPICYTERMDKCCKLLEDSVAETGKFCRSEFKVPYMNAVLTGLINSDEAHLALKPTVPKTRLKLPVATRTI